MNKLITGFILLMVISSCAIFSCDHPTISAEKSIAITLVQQINSFVSLCKTLSDEVQQEPVNEKKLKSLFLDARSAYKSFEWAAEYFVPLTSRFINGPPVPEIELSGQVFNPAGLQVIEGFLFPQYNRSKKKELLDQLDLIRSRCTNYISHFSNIDIFDWQVFDAAKLEVFRIETLGITGFDNPLTLKISQEASESLESLQKILSFYHHKDISNLLFRQFDAAINYLSVHTDFNSFDRAEFIVRFCDPLTRTMSDLQKDLQIKMIRYNRLLDQDARTLFDKDAYNVNAYAPDQNSFISKEKIALGKMLFEDPSLSGNGSRSCKSCHQPEKAFTDGLAKNTIIGKRDLLGRNTPTLINAALQPSLFYDMRVNTLEDQALSVVQNEKEMHGSIKLSVVNLWNDPIYRQKFSNAFPKKIRTGIDTLEVMSALGSYIRSLVYLNSRFDEFMRGDKRAMSVDEINGFNLFMGKAKCATCHYMPLFNGSFPPGFTKIDAEVIGVPSSIGKKEIDPDEGRFNIVKVQSLEHAFKTPSVRNVSLTPPYMHNGVFATLDQVMDFYNKGGGAGLGIRPVNQTLPFDKLDLTAKETKQIIAFMKALDSKY